MHIRKIELHNFQSHQRTVIDFVDDFNCIIGPSRSGKSSVVRALSFILFDEWDDSYVRNGTPYATVKLHLSNDTVVTRSKGPDTNEIRLLEAGKEEKVFVKFGISAPPDVKQALGVFPAKIDTDYEVNLNLSDQDSPPFLLSETAPTKTKFLNRLTGLHIIDTALRSINKDKLNLSTEKNQRQVSQAQLTQKLLKFAPLDSIKYQLEQNQQKVTIISGKVTTFISLNSTLKRLKVLEEKEQKVNAFLTWYTNFEPKTKAVQVKYDLLQQVKHIQAVSSKLSFVTDELKELLSEEAILLQQFKTCPFCGNELKDGQKVTA